MAGLDHPRGCIDREIRDAAFAARQPVAATGAAHCRWTESLARKTNSGATVPAFKLSAAARYAIMLLPVAFGAHIAEEWLGGFSAWTATALGREVSIERFLIINAVAFPIVTGCVIASLRSASTAWLAASVATLLGLNGVLHTLATPAFGRYSPGAVTGLLLYIPLAGIVLRSLSSQLPTSTFSRAVMIGIFAHACVAVFAFM